MTNQKSRKYARADGSFEYITSLVLDAIKKGLSKNQYASIPATYPDHVFAEIYTEDPVTYTGSTEVFKIPFSIDTDGNVTLGEATPAKEVKTFESTKMGLFVQKNDAKREVTGPVELPGCPDCDYKRGEKIRSVEEVAGFCNAFDNFKIADEMHLYGATGKRVGDVTKHWTIENDETYTNIIGQQVTLPRGTWMATTKITDDETWKKVEDGTYKGYSGTYLSKKDADELKKTLTASKNESNFGQTVLASANKRVLIKDLEEPTPVTISIVDNPCVPNAIFTSVKACQTSQKAGRSISNSTLSTLQKAHDTAQNALDNVKKLLKKAEGERPSADKEVDDMDEKELATLVGDTVDKKFDEKVKPISEKIEAMEKKLPEVKKANPPGNPGKTAIKCTKCEHEIKGAAKFCPECGDQILHEGEKPAEKLEDNPVIKGILESQKKITEKLGIPPESQKIEGQEDDPVDPAKKSDDDFYAQAGIKRSGRPKDEK
nr:XkdF-like putative serine protease domain-containing protein [uncultured Methanobacterium sp.]